MFSFDLFSSLLSLSDSLCFLLLPYAPKQYFGQSHISLQSIVRINESSILGHLPVVLFTACHIIVANALTPMELCHSIMWDWRPCNIFSFVNSSFFRYWVQDPCTNKKTQSYYVHRLKLITFLALLGDLAT